jgi:hypothetical protein
MDQTEKSRQAFLYFLCSRLNAAYWAFSGDEGRDRIPRWWHANLQTEMVFALIVPSLPATNFLVVWHCDPHWKYKAARLELPHSIFCDSALPVD